MEINEKDIVSFARVLISIGKKLEMNPEILMQILNTSKDVKKSVSTPPISQKVEPIQIYEIAKDQSKDAFVKHLKKFTSEQLRDVIKSNGFGSVRYKTIEKLAEYIADEVKKRSSDVFIHHE